MTFVERLEQSMHRGSETGERTRVYRKAAPGIRDDDDRTGRQLEPGPATDDYDRPRHGRQSACAGVG